MSLTRTCALVCENAKKTTTPNSFALSHTLSRQLHHTLKISMWCSLNEAAANSYADENIVLAAARKLE